MHDAMTARGLDSGMRDRALLAHATQIDPDGGFMRHDRNVERDVWPTEDYHLARSHVPVDLPENDLFAGVRPTR